MKRKLYTSLLAAEAVACVVLCLVQASFGNAFSTIMAFPFEQIGLGLRALSLWGWLGNILAVVLYLGLSLLPIAALVRKRRKLEKEDWLLGLLSVLLFVVLYAMVNPGMISLKAKGLSQAVGKGALGLLVYSVLCGYSILRMLRLFRAGGTEKLLGYLSVMLMLMGALFVYAAFGACFGAMLDSLNALKAGNVGNEHLLGTTYFCLGFKALVDGLPYLMNVAVVLGALNLLDEMRRDRYSESTVAAAERMCRLCVVALAATVLANIGFNLVQLLLVNALMTTHIGVQIPLGSIGFVLVALLLTRLITENKQLKDDNELFI